MSILIILKDWKNRQRVIPCRSSVDKKERGKNYKFIFIFSYLHSRDWLFKALRHW